MPIYHTTYTMNTYCLNCKMPGVCKCKDKSAKFVYSYKLRPPLLTKNKVKFRKFLDDCPTFVNMVSDDQQVMFLDLLREVKYFNKSINGRDWTNIKK